VTVVSRPAYRRDQATWVTFGALFAFGLLNALLGPVVPYLRETEHISYVVAALHQVAFALGGMTAGLLATGSSAPRRPTIVVGLVGAAFAGLLLGYGGLLPATIVAALLASGFATAALIRMWALLADLHRSHRAVALTEGEIAVSLAGVLTPALVGLCAATSLTWRFSTVVAFGLVVAAAVAVAVSPASDRQQVPRVDAPRDDPSRSRTRRTLTTIFAVVGLEFTLSFWAATYLHDDVGLGREISVVLVSTLYAANLVGRLLASRVARRRTAAEVLWLSLAIAFLGLPFLLAAGGIAAASIGLVVTGIGIGGTFPLASALHVEASGRSADHALGQTLAVAGIGQIVGPLVAGTVAQLVDLRYGLLVLPGLVVLAAVTVRPGDRGA
jgi:MFS family permease